ncbi:hypothetical protein BCR44DRAFT_1434392 [Catenaria anguillulae PL171]|uniref:Uncharacterized protein n=1 Tax=Catenaria anguillulae PL171 TaxID=765915 RepID=A0A1Y2HNY5_9FUNG|nr:hypothetical protein BCR44DRAFT_1434392 [Catenaria anguillulae PL171]
MHESSISVYFTTTSMMATDACTVVTDTDTEALPFELVDPVLILAARLIRPTNPQTRRLPSLGSDPAAAAAVETALTALHLVIHPSPDLCSTLLPRLPWFTARPHTGNRRWVLITWGLKSQRKGIPRST